MLQISVLLAATTLALLALLPREAEAGAACDGYGNILFCGELNGDCKVTAADALIALRMGVGQSEAVAEADLNHSGGVTAGDALQVLKLAVGSNFEPYDCHDQYGVKASFVATYASNGSRTNNNYAVGWYAASTAELRDIFVFDVSEIPGNIYSALLHLAAAPTGQSYYPNPSLSETFTLFQVTTDLATMTVGNPGAAGFDDLGSGTAYGGVVAVKGEVRAIIDVPLNVAGLAYLNGASGDVAFGGAITTLTKGAENEYLFNSTGATNVRELIVRVE